MAAQVQNLGDSLLALLDEGLITTSEFALRKERSRRADAIIEEALGAESARASLLSSTYALRANLQDLESERILVVQRIASVSGLVRSALDHASTFQGRHANLAEATLEERQEQLNGLIIQTQLCSTLLSARMEDNSLNKRAASVSCPTARLHSLIMHFEEEQEAISATNPERQDIAQQTDLTEKESNMFQQLCAVCDAISRLISLLIHLAAHTIKVLLYPVDMLF